MSVSTIPRVAESRFRTVNIPSGGTFDLTLSQTDQRFLVTMMASSETSYRSLILFRRGPYAAKAQIAAGSYQSYYTETFSNNVWHIQATYAITMTILEL